MTKEYNFITEYFLSLLSIILFLIYALLVTFWLNLKSI